MNNCPMPALSFYIRDVLMYNERQAVDIYHVFMMLCYLSAIIGGTILTFSILYWIGILMLFWSTVQIKNTLLTNFMALYSLVFISIGVGAIKCCIAAFGVDQLIGNNQNVTSTQVHGFFSTFYFSIHLGHTTWIFQASRTSDNLLGMPFSVYMLQVVNPLLVLFTIPLMDRLVYPYLKSHKLFKYPLKRMLLGGGIAGIAFIFAGCLEKCLEENMQDVSIHNASAYTKACSANIWISNLGLQKFNATGYFIFDHNIITPEYMKIRIPKRKNQTYLINDKGIIKKSIVLLVMENSLFKEDNTTFKSPSAVLVPENVKIGNMFCISIIVPSNENSRIWLRIKNLTLEYMSNNKIKIFEESFCVSQFQNNTILKIPSGLYTLTIHYMDKKQTPISMNVLKLETESIYIYRNEYNNNLMNSRFKSNAILQNRVLSKVWLLPQFVCMTFGETLFAMTGLSFSFSETPESMKTVSISMWYFCVALGNLTVICINKFIAFEKKSNMFFMFAFMALLTIIITSKLSNSYEKLYFKTEMENENEKDNVNL
ncbi:hypothetical protein AGLY_001025, partial [Aphis glycines]